MFGGVEAGLDAGNPGTLDVLNTSRAGFFVNKTCAVVAAAAMQTVPDTRAASRTMAVTTADAVSDSGGHTLLLSKRFPARKA